MSSGGGSLMSEQLSFLSDDGGSNPTSPLQLRFRQIRSENANRMFKEFHYAKREVPISWCFGAYSDNILLGAISFGKPASPSLCVGVCGSENSDRVYELNRLWMSDRCPKNSESRFIGWSLRQLSSIKPPLIIVSYADTAQNHAGAIYRATNWTYTGLSDARNSGDEMIPGSNSHSRHSFGDPRAVLVERSRKHRYVYFLNPSDRKLLRYPEVKWPKNPRTS